MAVLDQQQRIDLAALIKANKTDDCTQEIRSKKQSVAINPNPPPIIIQLFFLLTYFSINIRSLYS